MELVQFEVSPHQFISSYSGHQFAIKTTMNFEKNYQSLKKLTIISTAK